MAVGFDCDGLGEHKCRRGLLRPLPEGLGFLGAVDAVQPDTFGFLVVQDFDGVSIENTNHFAVERIRPYRSKEKKKRKCFDLVIGRCDVDGDAAIETEV